MRGNVRAGVTAGVRPEVRAAPVSSAAPKKKSFDRGGPVWPPRSNGTNDRLGGVWGAKPPQPKFGGSGGQRPPAKIRGEMVFFPNCFEKNSKKNNFTSILGGLLIEKVVVNVTFYVGT